MYIRRDGDEVARADAPHDPGRTRRDPGQGVAAAAAASVIRSSAIRPPCCDDVIDEMTTLPYARDVYGVVIDGGRRMDDRREARRARGAGRACGGARGRHERAAGRRQTVAALDDGPLRPCSSGCGCIRAFEEKASELYAQGPDHGAAAPGHRPGGRAPSGLAALAPRRPACSAATERTPTRSPRARTRRGCWPRSPGRRDRLLRRQGRLDAHRRAGGGLRDRDRRRGRQHPAGPRCRARVAGPGDGSASRRSRSSATAPGRPAAFHESLNIASLWGLPVAVRVREQRLRRVHARCPRTPTSSGWRRHAATYGIPATTVDGNDVVRRPRRGSKAVARARSGGGPAFVEALTYRLRGHYEGDPAKYRELSELDEWKAKDPIARFAGDRAIRPGRRRAPTRSRGVARGRSWRPLPRRRWRRRPPAAADLLPARLRGCAAMTELRMIDAIRARPGRGARRRPGGVPARARTSRVGGPFGATKGLVDRLRRRSASGTRPISEATVVGLAVGAALAGLRPVVEVMFIDFITLAMDQLVNHAAKLRYMSGGQLRVPLADRVPRSARPARWARTTRQSLEAWFDPRARPEGRRPVDAGGRRRPAAAGDPLPTTRCVFLEHRGLYWSRGDVPDTDAGQVCRSVAAIVRRPGKRRHDRRVVAHGRSCARAAADELATEGIEAEVIDLRTLRPARPRHASCASVAPDRPPGRRARGGRRRAGFGAEIAAAVTRARARRAAGAGRGGSARRSCRSRSSPELEALVRARAADRVVDAARAR